MIWPIRRKYVACSQCGVHFEPHPSGSFQELCSPHRAPRLEIERRKQLVVGWAGINWEQLEAMALASYAASSITQQAMMQNIAQGAAGQSGLLGGLGQGMPYGGANFQTKGENK